MSEPQQKRRWRRIDIVMALLSATVVALFASAAAFIYLEKSSQQSALVEADARLADLKARDVPFDGESLRKLYVSKTSRDDTAAWLEVFGHFARRKSQKLVASASPYGQSPQVVSQTADQDPLVLMRTLVNDNAELLKTVHALAGTNTKSNSRSITTWLPYAKI